MAHFSTRLPETTVNSILLWYNLTNETDAIQDHNLDDIRNVHATVPVQIAMGFVSTIANFLTLLALSQIKAKYHPHLILVVNLTISDMLFGIRTIVIRSIWYVFHYDAVLRDWFNPSSDPGCARKLIRVLGTSIYTCTYINLIAMAFDLYFAIMKPFSYQRLVTRKRTVIFCCCLWITALLFASTNYVVAFFHYIGAHGSSFCEIKAKYTALDVYVYLFVIYLGILIMTVVYTRIFIEVRRCAHYTPGLPVKEIQSVRSKKRKVVTSLLVLITFLVGWLPNVIFTTVKFAKPDLFDNTVGIVAMYFAWLPMANSICDPIIYAIRLNKVRIGFRKLCRRGYGRMGDADGDDIGGTEQMSMSTQPFQNRTAENAPKTAMILENGS